MHVSIVSRLIAFTAPTAAPRIDSIARKACAKTALEFTSPFRKFLLCVTFAFVGVFVIFVSLLFLERSIIEFERAEYVVFEDAGQVQIGVRLFDIAPGMQAADGTLNQEIMTRISTVDMTAEATAVDGKKTHAGRRGTRL